ncbi:hypothetical protein KYLE_71 [Pantoea phage Kyle]|uniref:Uncharacterized protein n=1 Tax=Pantoea phage Kyle TaxID=2589665 RepID=A0A514A8N0_9CAUD|nr:hypothetical protein HWC52_gp071 [Pantoea phage Kyle]QDH49633.1 hypothetical protein KYLE_71 [Pantoea phage Kyle]
MGEDDFEIPGVDEAVERVNNRKEVEFEESADDNDCGDACKI